MNTLCLAYFILFVLNQARLSKCESNQNQLQLNEKNLKCSRPHSRFVREYFARALLPIYQKYSVPVPDKCPFSPLHDYFHYHENNKTKLDTHRWKCELCGKLFISEKFLDKHFDKRHNSSLLMNANSNCLASYCRIFRCEVLMNVENSKPPTCYESTMVNLRQKCKNYLELCIPKGISYSIQNKLTIELRENLCSYLTCHKYTEQPSYMSKGPNFIIIFIIVVFIGLSIIAYGVINHTDLIFDEDEQIDLLNENSAGTNSQRGANMTQGQNSTVKSGISQPISLDPSSQNTLRHRGGTIKK